MNGAHDAGGQMGHGPILPEANEPVFHAPWERRLFALAMGNTVGWNIDEDRAACEAMPPLRYLTTSYYEHWLNGMELLVQRYGIATATAPKGKTAATAHYGYQRDVQHAPRFAVGDRVLARRINPLGHTRLPRYLRGHVGTIIRNHGAQVFPDSNSAGKGEDPQYLYTVEFKASEIWGTTTASTIAADLWEPYLEAL